MRNLPEIMLQIQAWAQEVGTIQLQFFRTSDLKIETKGHASDLVTEIDKKSEEIFIKKLKMQFPQDAILTEETGYIQGNNDYQWVLDPIDGTNNYAQGLPLFAISLALQHKGKTIMGIVYSPYLNEMYSAIIGGGAYLNGNKIEVAKKNDFAQCVFSTGFPYDKDVHPINNVKNFLHMAPQLRGIRRLGSAAYDLCAVAAGFLDGFWELNLSLWDVAAGILILQEAQGEVIYFRDDRKISLIAGNSQLTKLIWEEFKKIEQIQNET